MLELGCTRGARLLVGAHCSRTQTTQGNGIFPSRSKAGARCTGWHRGSPALSAQVELLVMKALSVGLVKGSIDEVDRRVHMTWVQPRVLDLQQVMGREPHGRNQV